VCFERGAQSPKMEVAVHAAELLLGLEHAGRAPAKRHLAVALALHVGRVVAADLDHRLDGVGGAQCPGQGRWHAEAADSEGLREALAQRRRRARMRTVQPGGQRLEVALPDEWVGVAVCGAHAPLDDPGHAEHAVAAALEMERVLLAFKRELSGAAGDFDVGIGIHSGSAVVGFIGARQKLDYTAIGDAVNLASRIEGLTKDAHSRILVSRETADACNNAFKFTSRGSYKVKGRTQEVELFEPRAGAS